MSLIDAIFSLTASTLANRASLKSQLERAAISIAANIAEGYGRAGRREYLHFLAISAASLRELETFLLIVHRNSMAPEPKVMTAMEGSA